MRNTFLTCIQWKVLKAQIFSVQQLNAVIFQKIDIKSVLNEY